MCAKGPTQAALAISASMITEWLLTVTSSPTTEFTIRTPACSSQRAPMDVRPSRMTPG